MSSSLTVINISCGRCGYLDKAEKFPDITSPDFTSIMKKLGHDLTKSEQMASFQTVYAGAVCPGCGNYSDLDFNPFNIKYQ